MRLTSAPHWVVGPVDRTGDARYVHLIRGADDPARRERYKGQDKAPHRTIEKTPVEVWRQRIVDLLTNDFVPRTFNRIALELTEKTADVVIDTPLDAALWQLVDEGKIWHTLEAPILFRSFHPDAAMVGCPTCGARPGEPCKRAKRPPSTSGDAICQHPEAAEGWCCCHGTRFGLLDAAKERPWSCLTGCDWVGPFAALHVYRDGRAACPVCGNPEVTSGLTDVPRKAQKLKEPTS